jgi:hypothetical protein
MKKHYAKQFGDKSCQSNFGKRSSDFGSLFLGSTQRYMYRVLQTIQMKLILLCVWAEPAVLGSAKTGLKFKYEI